MADKDIDSMAKQMSPEYQEVNDMSRQLDMAPKRKKTLADRIGKAVYNKAKQYKKNYTERKEYERETNVQVGRAYLEEQRKQRLAAVRRKAKKQYTKSGADTKVGGLGLYGGPGPVGFHGSPFGGSRRKKGKRPGSNNSNPFGDSFFGGF